MKKPKLPRPRAGVFSTSIYQPGRPLEEVLAEYGLETAVKLASNENLFGVSPKAVEAMRNAVERVAFYPDTNGVLLCRKVAELGGVELPNVLLGNGTVELIYDLLRAYVDPGDEVVMGAPSFSAYPIATRLMGGVPVEVPVTDERGLDLPAMGAAITERTKIVFLPNPNNPTGTLFSAGQLDEFLATVPEGVLVVVDEAYHDWVVHPEYPDSMSLLRRGEPVMVLRSLSKSLGIAGVRIGYGAAPVEVASAIRQVQVPFHCSVPAQAAALAGLDDTAFVEDCRKKLDASRKAFEGELRARGIEYIPSFANFVMLRPSQEPRLVSEALLRRGFIVRPGEDLGAPGWLRVTVGPGDVMERFLIAYQEACDELANEPARGNGG